MSKFIKNISLFFAGLSSLPVNNVDAVTPESVMQPTTNEPGPVMLRPLNNDMDNLFAAHGSHASHSSHASHASHYSGAGGGTVSPQAPTPASPPVPQAT